MTIISREQFNQLLTQEWPAYLARCQAFSPLERQEYLQQQGYPNLSGLLAHVVAWWQDGSRVVQGMRQEPDLQNPDYDVDVFNAQAVERFSGLSEAQMVDLFNQQRQAMLALVASLTDSEMNDERINTRLYYEIVYHLEEHLIKA